MKTAICDDQARDREQIREYLQQEASPPSGIKDFASADELLCALAAGERCDLIYLDIEMPGEHDGMAAARLLAQQYPQMMLVFVTSYREYVNTGYKVSAMDFLIKPIDPVEFHQAYHRCRQKYEARHHLVLESRDEVVSIAAGDILLVTTNGNYVDILYHGGAEPFTYRATLTEMESQLSEYGFCRCSPSYLVNLGYVRKLFPDEHDDKKHWVTIADDQQSHKVAVSHNKWQTFKRALHDYHRGGL